MYTHKQQTKQHEHACTATLYRNQIHVPVFKKYFIETFISNNLVLWDTTYIALSNWVVSKKGQKGMYSLKYTFNLKKTSP